MLNRHPLPPSALCHFGCTVVAAPHPDDETLGCGGLIALLRACSQTVQAVLVSDGSQSHPHSRRLDAAARQAWRAAEWQQALACLGVAPAQLHALAWPDGRVPGPGDVRFDAAVQQLRKLLARLAPQTLVLPWRRDPHPDHRATHALFVHAARGLAARQLEYAVWLPERGQPCEAPQPGEVRVWQLDIRPVLPAKLRAIACHRSQLGAGFTTGFTAGFTKGSTSVSTSESMTDRHHRLSPRSAEEPQGFVLPAGLLDRARAPYELYFEDAARASTWGAALPLRLAA